MVTTEVWFSAIVTEPKLFIVGYIDGAVVVGLAPPPRPTPSVTPGIGFDVKS